MQAKYKNNPFYRLLTTLLIVCILIGSPGNLFTEQVQAADSWISMETTGSNGIQSYQAEADTIIQTGKHNAADDNSIRYETKYYYMSKSTFDINSSFYSGTNAAIRKEVLSVKVQDGSVDEGTNVKTTFYTINRQEFIDVAAKLGVTGESLYNNGGATVYLSNVFQIMINNTELDHYVWGYPSMLEAASWSSVTKEKLKGYYNFPYKLSNVAFNVKIIAVDKNGNVLDGNLYETKKIYSEPIQYTLTEPKQTIVKNGITYEYNNRWYYFYTPANKTYEDYVNGLGGNSINVAAPDAEPLSTVTYKMVFDPKVVKYTYTIDAVDASHKYLGDMEDDKTQTQSGAKVEYKSIAAKRTVNGKEYNFQNQWYMTYIDESGNTVNTGTVNSSTILKDPMPAAKENSNAVFHLIYSPGPTPTPIPTPIITGTPSPTPTASPTPTLAPINVPSPGIESLPFTSVNPSGVLRADVRGTERFVATLGVPTIESLYGEVTSKEYLLGYQFEKKVGKEYFSVKVTRNYVLKWNSATPASAGGPKPQQEIVPVTKTVTVERAYGYWEIMNLECYGISNVVINNYALPNGSITILPNYFYYNPPSISVWHSSNSWDHVLPPMQAVNGIQLSDVVISTTGSTKPTIPNEDFTHIAKQMTGKARVKSDYLTFNGATIISDAITETEAPNINTSAMFQCTTNTNASALYSPNNVIEATKKNGTYPTQGTITYTKIAKLGSFKSDTLQYGIGGLSNVVIHTPVVCDPTITANNDSYVQLINPTEGCVELVLDPNEKLSDFTVHVSNTGHHSGKQGYFTRDFSRSIRNPDLSYISLASALLKNQVKFPFDTYIDKGVANNCSDDDFIKANTWITIDRSSPRFYLPITVNEGVYTVNFRTIAVNGEDYLSNTETFANTQLSNYVATNTVKVEVSGRIYGLTMFDISDYPIWEDIFRIEDSSDFKKDNTGYVSGAPFSSYSSSRYYNYTVGTNDQYGNDTNRNNKYTFPLVNSSHPRYKNIGILKTGYVVRYSLETVGNMFSDACKVAIKPNFYYVDKHGKNRVAVDLYYTENINKKTRHLVKVGSALDQVNLKEYSTGDIYLGIPEAELKQTAKLRGLTYGAFTSKMATMFNFSDIRLNCAFRTYVNNAYLNKVKAYDSYEDLQDDGITDNDILGRIQRWYGSYYLPNEIHIVAKGFDVLDYADKYGVDYDEVFWLEDGYIIVNFSIETVGEDSNRRLSYINSSNYTDNDNCSMWVLENPVLTKASYNGPTFNFYAGDFVIYYSNKRMSDDYDSGAVY